MLSPHDLDVRGAVCMISGDTWVSECVCIGLSSYGGGREITKR